MDKICIVRDGRSEQVTLRGLGHVMNDEMGATVVTLVTPNPSVLPVMEVLSRLLARMPEMAPEQQEYDIEDLVSEIRRLSPLSHLAKSISEENAERRAAFLREFKGLTAEAVEDLVRQSGTNQPACVENWRKQGRIFGLPVADDVIYPAFQFNEAGWPYPLLADVLSGLPSSLGPWQRAFWIVSPNASLNGRRPIELIRSHDRLVMTAVTDENIEVVG